VTEPLRQTEERWPCRERLTKARAQVSIGDYDNKRYCNSVALQSATPARTQGPYTEFAIPLSQFNCPFAVSAASQVRAREKAALRGLLPLHSASLWHSAALLARRACLPSAHLMVAWCH